MALGPRKKYVKDDENEVHSVAYKKYSKNSIKFRTFCRKYVDFDEDNKTETFTIPMGIIDETSYCWDCYRRIQSHKIDSMPSSQRPNSEEDMFLIRSILRLGESRGTTVVESINASSIGEAKKEFENLYPSVDEFTYLRISKRDSNKSIFRTVYRDERV